MNFVPWQYIADWKCNSCGDCCKLYSVVLAFPEWLQINTCFGPEKTIAGLDRLYIKKGSDGSCPFAYNYGYLYLCGLQRMKPGACRQWPFRVLSEPKFGDPTHATYNYGSLRLFVYADTSCSGLRYGSPQWEFANLTMREFIELALGKSQVQHKTTNQLKLL